MVNEVYNLTNVTNATGYNEIIVSLNSLSGDLLGVTIVLSLFFIMFIGLILRESLVRDAFAASTWVTTVFTLLLWALGIVGEVILFIFVILTAVSVVMLRIRGAA